MNGPTNLTELTECIKTMDRRQRYFDTLWQSGIVEPGSDTELALARCFVQEAEQNHRLLQTFEGWQPVMTNTELERAVLLEPFVRKAATSLNFRELANELKAVLVAGDRATIYAYWQAARCVVGKVRKQAGLLLPRTDGFIALQNNIVGCREALMTEAFHDLENAAYDADYTETPNLEPALEVVERRRNEHSLRVQSEQVRLRTAADTRQLSLDVAS